jgi:two-component system chemotaxis response regulator CheY
MTAAEKMRVLIADDEAHSRALMKAVLTEMGHEIVGEASHGDEALASFRQLKPDLLLLDVNMPVMAGQEVLKAVLAEFPDAFVIMLTAVSDMETVEKCLALGASHYIRKDTSLAEIRQIIQESRDFFTQDEV